MDNCQGGKMSTLSDYQIFSWPASFYLNTERKWVYGKSLPAQLLMVVAIVVVLMSAVPMLVVVVVVVVLAVVVVVVVGVWWWWWSALQRRYLGFLYRCSSRQEAILTLQTLTTD